ncbi:LysR family transcriptional regulator [uncultured Shewanella sp.]|uniref:LysR family transcriptional regulator n=1 Tax=uncultured Shewanella sp. TaxID=173975 RepID=UPI0026378906|nr:LysR family transcriptional regulator [uncultured Shewanella sp.]
MDRFLSMKIFVRIIQLGSFTAVASELNMTQSSISKKIAALEKNLGTKLIIRNSRQILLADVASHYYKHCIRILNELELAENEIKENTLMPTGNLRMSLPDTFGRLFITPHLIEFKKKYPKINLDIDLLGRRIDLINEGVDVAIRIGHLADSNLIARKIGSCGRLLVSSPKYLSSHGYPQTLDDLKSHNCLCFTQRGEFNHWNFIHNSKEICFPLKGTVKSSSADVLKQCVLAGLGVAVLPQWLIEDEIASGKLVTLLPDFTPVAFPIHAIYPQNNFVPLKVKCFIKHYIDIFSNNPIINKRSLERPTIILNSP